MSTVMDVLDEVLPLLEPTASARDMTLARPVEYAPNTLYGWPLSERFDVEGTGGQDLDQFTLRLAWATPADMEVAEMLRSRDSTLLIRARVEATHAWIRGRRAGTTYENLQVAAIDYDSLITHQVRGVLIDVAGYQLIAN